jgi:hypothetical protein
MRGEVSIRANHRDDGPIHHGHTLLRIRVPIHLRSLDRIRRSRPRQGDQEQPLQLPTSEQPTQGPATKSNIIIFHPILVIKIEVSLG